MTQAFSGNPKKYFRLALIIPALLCLWIYVGFNAAKYIFLGENWLSVWQLPVTLVVISLFVSRMYYRSMMRLDAQYGKGSGWILKEAVVKLPEQRIRKKKPS
jgi:hypothetical protein